MLFFLVVLGVCAFLHRAWAREGSGRLVGSGRVLGQGLSRPRVGFGGFGSVCILSQGVGKRGHWALGGIRLCAWGGPLGAERGLWGGWGLSPFLHMAWMREGSGRLVGSERALGEGLSGPREGFGGFGCVCIP